MNILMDLIGNRKQMISYCYNVNHLYFILTKLVDFHWQIE